MRLTVQRHDPRQFLAAAGPFLIRHEAQENLLLGIAHSVATQPETYLEPVYLATVQREDEVVMAAIRTPPRFLVLSRSEDMGALDYLLADVRQVFPSLPGVLGPRAIAGPFAEAWAQHAGQVARRTMEQRIYQLSRVDPPPSVPGAMRAALLADEPLLSTWLRQFFQETGGHGQDLDFLAQSTLAHHLGRTDAGLCFWERDGIPVSLAGFGGPTPTGMRIGPVYTPPSHRRRGYASALVAAVSQQLLDNGRAHCFLFTDLSNPTSNNVYRRIGYQAVGDVEEYQFQPR
jgi:predicted GNAT family acetyltransferase